MKSSLHLVDVQHCDGDTTTDMSYAVATKWKWNGNQNGLRSIKRRDPHCDLNIRKGEIVETGIHFSYYGQGVTHLLTFECIANSVKRTIGSFVMIRMLHQLWIRIWSFNLKLLSRWQFKTCDMCVTCDSSGFSLKRRSSGVFICLKRVLNYPEDCFLSKNALAVTHKSIWCPKRQWKSKMNARDSVLFSWNEGLPASLVALKAS